MESVLDDPVSALERQQALGLHLCQATTTHQELLRNANYFSPEE